MDVNNLKVGMLVPNLSGSKYDEVRMVDVECDLDIFSCGGDNPKQIIFILAS